MTKLCKIIDRAGLVLTRPGEGFDLLVVEGSTFREGLAISILAFLGLASTIVSYDSSTSIYPLTQFLFAFTQMFFLWIVFSFILSNVIQTLYNIPGNFMEYFGSVSYSLITAILPVSFKLVILVVPIESTLTSVMIEIVVSAIWGVWLIILIYMFIKRYYKLSVKQFLASIFISLVLTGIVVAIVSGILLFILGFNFSVHLVSKLYIESPYMTLLDCIGD